MKQINHFLALIAGAGSLLNLFGVDPELDAIINNIEIGDFSTDCKALNGDMIKIGLDMKKEMMAISSEHVPA